MTITDKDRDFVTKLIGSTEQGHVKWQPTANPDQYVSSFKGKWSVIVDEYREDGISPWYTVKVRDAQEREMLSISDGDFPPVRDLYESARRAALNVDEALDDIMKDLDADMPF